MKISYTYRQVGSRPDRDGRCRVVLDVTCAGRRTKVPTGVSCLPAHFNPDARRVVSTKDPDSGRLNALLAAALAKVEREALKAEVAEQPFVPLPRAPRAAAVAAPLVTAPEFYAAWLADNPNRPFHSARRYKQVVSHLEAYRPCWPLLALTRVELQAYVVYLAEIGLVDSSVSKHVIFLRECFRLGGKVAPGWLKLRVRYGRSPALQAAELRTLLALPLADAPALAAERDLFALQTMLLLRDSDLRSVRPHHVAPVDFPGRPAVPVLTLRQQKTGDEVRLPLPPQAAEIWQRCGGQLPVPVQQYRNRHMKQLMERAGFVRPFVRVHYVRGQVAEAVLPLWQTITTHTARHTGADMVMLGSGGDDNLKEKALGHAGVYGHDALERYGPLLLDAWAAVLGATP